MKRWMLSVCVVLLAAVGLGFPARAADRECKNVAGRVFELQVPAPNDPFGRVLGTVTGVLEGSVTAILTSPPGPATSTFDVFLTKSGDAIAATGEAAFDPTDNVGVVLDDLTLTIVWGSGKFEGATGTINLKGEGFNVLPPPAGGPGLTYFTLQYRGSICVPK